MQERSRIFLGYPTRPQAQREAIQAAATKLNDTQQVRVTTWESLKSGSRLVIDRITEAIDESELVAFDVTALNQNVLFELGYAIGREKRIWLLRDDSLVAAKEKWNKVGLLSTVVYYPFRNSDDIARGFFSMRPDEGMTTLYDDLIRPSLPASGQPSLFYIPDVHNPEANRIVVRRIHQERQHSVRVVMADPTESSAEPLSWYAQELHQAIAVVVHFTSPTREFADIHNARTALIAGLALGMRKPVLMLGENDLPAPIDYRDLMYRYPNAKACLMRVNFWLGQTLSEAKRQLAFESIKGFARPPARDLRSLRLGEHVAENEEDNLASYFVETVGFEQVLAGRAAVFVGRKGAGKTANLFQAASRLAADPRNLVVVVKPVGYEWDSLLRLLRKYTDTDSREFLLLALWKFLLESEIADAAAQEIERRPAGPVFGTPDWSLLQFLSGEGAAVREDFAVRLEAAVANLESVPKRAEIGATRKGLAEALESGITRELRGLLGNVLRVRSRVAILVDNLDKPWERGADFPLLARFLLALPSAAARLTNDFQKANSWRAPIPVTVSVFLRTDVFSYMLSEAKEPDKIPFTRLVWTSGEMLLRVVEERYVAARAGEAERAELWETFFCPHMQNEPTTQYLLFRALPRPRDIVFLCNAAITSAVNNKHGVVQPEDIYDAEKQYSRFAFEAILVEDEASGSSLDAILLEFIGGPALLSESEVLANIANAGKNGEAKKIIEQLRVLSFLEIETADGEFEKSDDPAERTVADRLAERLASSQGRERRYRVHPAFRPFLDIKDIRLGSNLR